MTILFSIEDSDAVPAPVRNLAGLRLRERDHLEEWVIAHTQVLGEDVMIVTSELSRLNTRSSAISQHSIALPAGPARNTICS